MEALSLQPEAPLAAAGPAGAGAIHINGPDAVVPAQAVAIRVVADPPVAPDAGHARPQHGRPDVAVLVLVGAVHVAAQQTFGRPPGREGAVLEPDEAASPAR